MSLFQPFGPSVTGVKRHLLHAGTWLVLGSAWELLHATNPIVPSLLSIVRALRHLLQCGLLVALLESYTLNLWALALAMAFSFGFAYLYVFPIFRPFVDILTKIRFLGFSGITFLMGMYFEGRRLQIALLVFGISFFFLTSMVSVVRSIPTSSVDHARTLQFKSWQLVYEVAIRGTFDQGIDTLRQNAAIGWVMLTMVEALVRTEGGVGIFLIDAGRHLRLAEIFAIAIMIVTVGRLQDRLIGVLRQWLCPYSPVKED